MTELLIPGIVSIMTGVIGFVFGRRKNVAQARCLELDSVDKAVKIWRETAENMANKVKELEERINQLQCENNQLKDDIITLKKQVNELTRDNKKSLKNIQQQINDSNESAST